jgi:V-type H+-transporting ATPase subunit a
MFGDIGHGAVLLLTGIFLCLFEPCLSPRLSSLKIAFKMRYILLLLGLFATFTGFIYNDMMAIPLELFPSCYDKETGLPVGNQTTPCVYPVGVDPAWYLAKNELQFMNSLKMKLAVILGVLQMSLGVFMKGLNAIYFRNDLDFLHEFIPQILLLWVLFGYMDILIVLKWLTDYRGKES